MAAADILVLSDYATASNNTGADDLLDSNAEQALTTLVGATLVANSSIAIRGVYSSAAGTFVGSTDGADTLFVYDANDAIATTTAVAVVLVGTGANTFTYASGDTAGTITLG
jgi:hypothetical protein